MLPLFILILLLSAAFTNIELEKLPEAVITVSYTWWEPLLVSSTNLSAFKVPSGEITELLVIEEFDLVQSLWLKSSE